MVVVFAQMAQPNMLQVFLQMFCQKMGSVVVSHVTVRTGNAIFQILWIGPVFKHLVLIVGFQNQVVGFFDVILSCRSDMSKVCKETECFAVTLYAITHIVCSVMRYLEGCDGEVKKRKGVFLFNQLDVVGC